MKNLTIGSFKRIGDQGSFAHYFEHELDNGDTICLESCLGGYCVARYDEHKNIIGEKTCTKIEGMMEAMIAPGFSMLSGDALMKAVEIANEKYV